MKKKNKRKNKRGVITSVLLTLLRIAYIVIYRFDNLIVRLFNKLPRTVRVTLIYTMVIITVLSLRNYYTIAEPIAPEEEAGEVIQIAMVEKEEKKCPYNEIECEIYNKAIELELTHKQALIVIAISKHETGNWTSDLYINSNNWGGNWNGRKQTFYKFATKEEGLEYYINNLKAGYFDKGRNTIEEIGSKYCPVGAKNDPKNINKHWIPRVTEYYNDYLNQ